MKKNMLLIVAIALVGTVTLTLNSLRAQNGPPPGAPPPSSGQAMPPGMHPGPNRGRPGSSYAIAIMQLRRVKMDLERSKEDYDGHRQTAIDACDKALQELEAVHKSIQAAEAARIAAAKAAAAAQQAPASAPAPAPGQ
jgi:hypothetical protein